MLMWLFKPILLKDEIYIYNNIKMNIIINNLEKNDFQNYLHLMNQFRPINKEISYELFCELYDKIYLSSEIYVVRLNNNIIGSINVTSNSYTISGSF